VRYSRVVATRGWASRSEPLVSDHPSVRVWPSGLPPIDRFDHSTTVRRSVGPTACRSTYTVLRTIGCDGSKTAEADRLFDVIGVDGCASVSYSPSSYICNAPSNMRHAACTTQDASDSIAVGCADSHARRRGRPTAPRAPRSLRRTPASVPRQSRSKTAAVAQSVLRATAVRTAVTKRCSGAVTAAKTLRSHSAHSGTCRSAVTVRQAVQCSAVQCA
jgi:hypothetical protein